MVVVLYFRSHVHLGSSSGWKVGIKPRKAEVAIPESHGRWAVALHAAVGCWERLAKIFTGAISIGLEETSQPKITDFCANIITLSINKNVLRL